MKRMAALRAFAASEAGEAQADGLLAVWLLLDDADRRVSALDFGEMLQFGQQVRVKIFLPKPCHAFIK